MFVETKMKEMMIFLLWYDGNGNVLILLVSIQIFSLFGDCFRSEIKHPYLFGKTESILLLLLNLRIIKKNYVSDLEWCHPRYLFLRRNVVYVLLRVNIFLNICSVVSTRSQIKRGFISLLNVQ